MAQFNVFGRGGRLQTDTKFRRISRQRDVPFGKAARDSGLFASRTIPSIALAMTHLPARRLLTLVLAVIVALSMNLSALQASGMASETAGMSAMSGMDSSMPDDCQTCPSKCDGAAMVTACGPVCAAPAMAMFSQESPATLALAQIAFLKRQSLLHGRAYPPDPYPPRSSDIG